MNKRDINWQNWREKNMRKTCKPPTNYIVSSYNNAYALEDNAIIVVVSV